MIRREITEKTLWGYTNWLSPNNYKKNDKIIYNYFKKNMPKENLSLNFRLGKITGTRHYLLEKIKNNDLINEKHKKCAGL